MLTADHAASDLIETRVVSDEADEQTAQVISQMADYVRQDSSSPFILLDAAQIGERARRSGRSLPEETFYFVQERIRFVQDRRLSAPYQPAYRFPFVEVLIRPQAIAEACNQLGCSTVGSGLSTAGDCDDFAMYTATLLTALGIKAKFVTVAADPAEPEAFSHVYVAAYPKTGERIPLDTSHGSRPGWEVNQIYRKQEWPIQPSWLDYLIPVLILAAALWAATGALK